VCADQGLESEGGSAFGRGGGVGKDSVQAARWRLLKSYFSPEGMGQWVFVV
jgi:hypothetical protein